MTLQEKLNSIKDSKAAIKEAITTKTGSDAGDVLSSYAEKINGISTGGTTIDETNANYSVLLDPDYPDLTSITINQGEIYLVVDNRDNYGYIDIGGLSQTGDTLKIGYIKNNTFVEIETGDYSTMGGTFNTCKKYFGSNYSKYIVCKVECYNKTRATSFIVNDKLCTIIEVYVNNILNTDGSLIDYSTKCYTSCLTERITFKNCYVRLTSNISYMKDNLRKIIFDSNCKLVDVNLQYHVSPLRVLDLRGVDTSDCTYTALSYCQQLEEVYSDDKNIFNIIANKSGMFYRLRKFPVLDSITSDVSIAYIFNISPNTLTTIINNLYDYSGSDTTYTLTIHTRTSDIILTDELKALATEKGWTIAVRNISI